MKYCTYCGKGTSDETQVCAIDGNQLAKPGEPANVSSAESEATRRAKYVSAENSFCQDMTFKKLAVIFVRLQGLWLLFDAAMELTYIPNYFRRYLATGVSGFALDSQGLFLFSIRVIAHVAAGFAIIIYAEKFLGWLVKDLVEDHSARKI